MKLLRIWVAGILLLCLSAVGVFGQAVTFSNTEEVHIPDYATLRIGPFYSTIAFSQSIGYRWTGSSGQGTDYLYNNRRGEILKDGSDFPMISTLSFRNYLLITRHMDLDISFWMSYEYYPMKTQENGFYFDMPEEGVLGTITLHYRLTPVVTGVVYDKFLYRTDYFDTRGYVDRYGGERYEHIDNTIGTYLDWHLASDKKIHLDFSRQDIIPYSDGFEDQERVTYEEMLEYSQRVWGNLWVGANATYDQTSYKVNYRPDNTMQSYYLFARYNEDLGDKGGVRLRLSDYTTASVGIGYTAGLNGELRTGNRVQDYNGITTTNDVRERYDASGDDFMRFVWFANVKTYMREDLWHSLQYSSSVETGYRSAFEFVDSLEYRLEWHGQATTATFLSEYRAVEPDKSVFSSYNDWINQLDVYYPLTRVIELHGMVSYDVRENASPPLNEDLYLPETVSDYNTWVARIGTDFHVTKTIEFFTYYTHVSRDSDNEDLVYTRDIFEATFRYTHQF